MRPFLVLLAALRLSQTTNAQPVVSYPLNSQLPPVARTNHDFSYVFSPYTFKSDSNITYTLGEHPAWLSLDGDERRLFGRPADGSVPPGDVVGQTVEIIATDATGASATLNATLVVSRLEGPSVNIPIQDQMENFGPHSAPSSLLAYPQTSFKYTFDPDTFDHEPDMINYYAVSSNSSPLPSWVHFDASTLTFSGVTPPFESLIQPPQTFNFELVASDIVGFSSVSMPFSIMVGTHKLTAENPTVSLDATRGSKVNFDSLKDEVKLDGSPISPDDLKVSVSGMPPWLEFHSDTWEIEGTPRQGDRSTNFTINFKDPYEDVLEVLVMVNVATSLFQSTVEDIEVRGGEELDIDLAPYFRDPHDIMARISSEPKQDWLKLSNLILSGKAPENADGDVKISVEAKSKSSGLKEKVDLNLRFLAAKKSASTLSGSKSSTSRPALPSHTKLREVSSEEDPVGPEPGKFSTSKILLATIIPIVAVAFALMLLVCLLRRRRARGNYLNHFRRNISKPVAGGLQSAGSDTSVQRTEKVPDAALNADANADAYATPARVGYAEVPSQASSSLGQSDSSEALSASNLPRGQLTGYGPDAITDASRPTTGNRGSWLTIEVTGTAPSSQGARDSQQNVGPFHEPRQQLQPAPDFFSGTRLASDADSLDLTIPLFGELQSQPSQQTTVVAYNASGQIRRRGTSDAMSTTTTSSAALPGSDANYEVARSVPINRAPIRCRSSSQPNPLFSSTSEQRLEESLEELRALNRSRGASHNWLTQHQETGPWYDGEASNGSKSAGTGSASFGSSENWRSIGRQEMRSPTYGELVEGAPFHPSRPSTAMISEVLRDGTQPSERGSSVWMSPSRWGSGDPGLKRRIDPPTSWSSAITDVPPMPSPETVAGALQLHSQSAQSAQLASRRLSRLTETSSQDGPGDRGSRSNTPKASQGSFKMFL